MTEQRAISCPGRDSTTSWPDLKAIGTALTPGVILGGEAVVFT
ncbi:hypothetical protein ACIO6U_21105 [Streptomyces sp. NPDC087422]